ncbi:uncharacterized protein B0I36DRAFT_252471 [Microdochium trichocladiopsis]|uniref:C2H2-type domain-containing protein n=1 Tax=Microdochium trichocladiopsis TaxID=1682393 RepID=A0A9P8XVL1_9PEZI|nr:uncharacterized protein B0I36DRAFT_252471 [Microdochium trichocladiopsis]KAH7020959.1 hypothetical protein B0I36DRAFT_252471 [Microdochium trichocladiopsis]
MTADEATDGKQQKPKTLPCRYCSKRFRRVEHVQRHERTHTKEKPFSCGWARCGKTFGRRDLLVRHEKLVHLNEGSSKDGNRPRKSSSGESGVHNPQQSPPQPIPAEARAAQDLMSMPHQHQQAQPYQREQITSIGGMGADHRVPSRPAACNLDLLSDAATQLASANEMNAITPMVTDMSNQRIKNYDDVVGYGDRARDHEPPTVGFQGHPGPTPPEDFNLFLDEFSTSAHFLPPGFEGEQSVSSWLQKGGPSKPASQMPTRFSSLAPDPRDMQEGVRMSDDAGKAAFQRLSATDHNTLKNRLDEFTTVLPSDFIFPSRHTLTRFVEGYVSGFHDHLPILHLPTLSAVDMSPELLLAILAVGAQYRFESHRSNALWYAAKAVALEQIRRRRSREVSGLLPTPAAYSPHSTRPSPSHGFRHSFSSVQQERPMTQDTHREPYSPNTPQARMETTQAILLLFAVGLWGAKAILHEALSLQSLLSLLVREEGLVSESTQTADWESWVRIEGANRMKLTAYCFSNLCSIAYNMPPSLLTSELNLFLPNSSRLWRAESAWQWQEMRHSVASMDTSLQDAFSRLFSRSPQGPPPYISSLGNYVLIHALLQHIFLLKQTSFTSVPSFEAPRGLRPDDVDDCFQALRFWQMSFEQQQARASESGQNINSESFPGGAVVYNSTALWRLASIRLYTDLSPSRVLETRDASLIAQGFSNAPYLIRSVRLNRAVLQAIHALSMLVKLGVNYVARRKSTEWSMQHSLCNLECAILLSKWLITLSAIGPSDSPLSPEERNLLAMLRRMLDETEFAVPIDPSLARNNSNGSTGSSINGHANEGIKLRQLAAAVIRLWAETFKGSHIFDVVQVIGNGLDGYAEILEKPPTPPLIGANAALG